MKAFMDKDFLLETDTAKHLFHHYAEQMPLVDYHCHISPREIYENRRFNDLVEVWLGGKQPDGSYFGDHYKWRVMRSNGVSEDYVTGDKPPVERLKKFAEALELAIGNPMYHWCNLELRKFFGYEGYLSPETVDEVWAITSDQLQNDPRLTVRGLIEQSNVAFIGTTDDPVDPLEWHKKIAADPTIRFQVCPSYRPDKAINITKPGFADYMAKLAQSVGRKSLDSVADVCDALVERLEFFKTLGCRASDHGLGLCPLPSRHHGRGGRGLSEGHGGRALEPGGGRGLPDRHPPLPGPGLPSVGHCHAAPLLLPAQCQPADVYRSGARHRL